MRGKVLIGELDGVRSPAHSFSPLVGADLIIDPGASITLPLDPAYEYGVFVVDGLGSTVESTSPPSISCSISGRRRDG